MRNPSKNINIQVDETIWVRILFCIKHLMKLHPELNETLIDFYAQLWDIYPVRLKNGELDMEEGSGTLDEMIWDLGMNLPSWDDDIPPKNGS